VPSVRVAHCGATVATFERTLAADTNRLFAHEADENVLSGGID